MEFRKLRYFVVAAEEENFHRAASRLLIAQPALTRHIKELEDELGLNLFDRSKRRVKLSPAGELLLKRARRILAEVEQTVAQMQQVSEGTTGHLRISFNPASLSYPPVPETFRVFRRDFPHVELHLQLLTARAAIDALLADQIDVAYVVRYAETDHRELESFPITRINWVLAVPNGHPLAKRDGLRLSDFKGDDFLFLPREQTPETYDMMVPLCITAGLNIKIVHAAGDFRTYLTLVAAGLGVTLTVTSVANDLVSSNVVFKRLLDFAEPIYLDMLWMRDRDSLILREYVDLVKSQPMRRLRED